MRPSNEGIDGYDSCHLDSDNNYVSKQLIHLTAMDNIE